MSLVSENTDPCGSISSGGHFDPSPDLSGGLGGGFGVRSCCHLDEGSISSFSGSSDLDRGRSSGWCRDFSGSVGPLSPCVGRGLDLGRGGVSGVVGRCHILSRDLEFGRGRGPSWWDHALGRSSRCELKTVAAG